MAFSFDTARTLLRVTPRARQAIHALTLLPAYAAIYFMTYWVRYDGHLSVSAWSVFLQTLFEVVAVKLFVFGWFRFYRGWSRYLTFEDLLTVLKATTCSSLITALIDYLFQRGLAIPRSVFLMDWGATVMGIGGLRMAIRMAYQHGRLRDGGATRIVALIVGANDAGEGLLRAIGRHGSLRYRVIGFVDDHQPQGMTIGGVPVLGAVDDVVRLVKRYKVEEVLVTAGHATARQLRALLADARPQGFRVKIVPSYDQVLDEKIEIQPRSVAIEDLLRRDPVRLDMQNIRQWVDGRVLMVTGSAGSIGSEICRQLLHFSPERIVLVDRSETGQFFLERELRSRAPHQDLEVCMADITDRARMDALFRHHRPTIVFHAAAYKHVPLMEDNAGEAFKNIVLATRLLAELAEKHRAGSLVMVSTDKAVSPTSIMGACKRLAELYVQSISDRSACRFVTVRFGNVLDSAGSVVPIFRQQIAGGGPVTVTHPDMVRYFMTIPEASQLVIQSGAMGDGGEIFVLDMGEAVRIVDLAADMIRLSGLRVDEDIEIEFTGVRPGEKLFEELFDDRERYALTRHEKIMVAEGRRHEAQRVSEAIARLEHLVEAPNEIIAQQIHDVLRQFSEPEPAAPTLHRRAA